MGEDLDVDAMLEAAFEKKGGDGEPSENQSTEVEKSVSNGESKDSKSKDKEKDREREKDKDREREKDKDRERDKDKDKERSRDRKERDRRRSRSRDRRRSRSRDRKQSRSRSRDRDRKDRDKADRRRTSEKEKRRSRSPRDRRKSRSPRRDKDRGGRYDRKRTPTPPKKPTELTAEERDARTVFCMQLSQRVRARDLEDFFSAVGKVKDVRLIMCNKTRRFKGLCYVEFASPESVSLAIALTGQKLLGVPIVVQPTQAEKNRLAAANAAAAPQFPKGPGGPMRLYVGSLHFNITEDMLRSIFEPFGKIDSMQLMMDPETGRSKGYCFITYKNGDDAKKAMEQLNGFELAGRPMKINYVTEHFSNAHASFDSDEMDRAGIDLGTTGRLQLMAKLAQGTGLEIPDATKSALTLAAQQQQQQQQQTQFAQSTAAAAAAPPIATPCFMLSNMFDPNTETHPMWDVEIRDDVIDECNKHGGAVHIYVDKTSPQGNVYVKCPSVNAAFDTVTSLHGRWFAGRVITAAYVPLQNYNSLFPDTVSLTTVLVKRG